jgi:NADH dehydrogenase FAD-containing subunit
MAKRVLLLGGGAAHLQVLKALATQPLAGAEVALVTPFALQVPEALVPAVVAGRCGVDEACVALAPLAAAGRVHLIEASVTSLDAAARRACLSDGRVVDYDLLSLDTAPQPDRNRIPGARDHGLFLQPAEHFVRLVGGLWDLAQQRVLDVVVVGAGAAAVELALAVAQRLTRGGEERARVALVTGGGEPMADFSARAQAHTRQVLARHRVTVFRDACLRLEPGAVVLANGARVACDAPLVATAAEPPAWLPGSGLALDTQGQVTVGATLQSPSHAEVLLAPSRGVANAAVAQVLTHNLRGLCGGGPLRSLRPTTAPSRFVDLGASLALVDWGGGAALGRWVGWWKRRRDRRALAPGRTAALSRSAGTPG